MNLNNHAAFSNKVEERCIHADTSTVYGSKIIKLTVNWIEVWKTPAHGANNVLLFVRFKWQKSYCSCNSQDIVKGKKKIRPQNKHTTLRSINFSTNCYRFTSSTWSKYRWWTANRSTRFIRSWKIRQTRFACGYKQISDVKFKDSVGRALSAALHTPQLGAHWHRGPKIQSPHHLAPQRKLRSSKLKYEALESEVRWPFERKVLMYYSYFGLLWKQSTLHITVAKGGPRQVPRLPSIKHTTVYNPDDDRVWEYETDWTRSALSDVRTFSPDVLM